MDKYREQVIVCLKNNASPTAYWSILVEMKENGVSKEDAHSLFTNMREEPLIKKNEDYDDKILDLLDHVCEYVAPRFRVW